ncbi:MAG: hypothetical protein L0H31_10775 [Nocardioidaceae bacterium]|nr:hypothetical protein [Nocardioidaceae bacterium]
MSTPAGESASAEQPYDVVLLIEQALSPADAAQVRALHQELDDDPRIEVVYHVLIPMEDAAAAIESSLGAIGGADVIAPPITPSPEDIEHLREEYQEQAERDLATSTALIEDSGARVGSGTIVVESPVDSLIEKVTDTDGREAIILTRPHVVAEFFHVDWTSRARRKLGVPVLHLLEHEQSQG